MATHTLEAEGIIDALRDATERIRHCVDEHGTPITSSVRDTLLTLDGLAGLLDGGDDIVFEREDDDDNA